jgi:Raf kinase inhibitor-like YbhB/YbcL family protein
MKKILIFTVVIIVLGTGLYFVFSGRSTKSESSDGQNLGNEVVNEEKEVTISDQEKEFALSSQAFEPGGLIPSKYTCDAENISPPLSILGIPKKAESLVLIVDDPDAPAGTWNHWLVWNITPSVESIMENGIPEGGVQGKNDFGNDEYGGPCPPSGTHRYFFRLYALDEKLNLESSSSREQLDFAMEGHILKETSLMGKYSR